MTLVMEASALCMAASSLLSGWKAESGRLRLGALHALRQMCKRRAGHGPEFVARLPADDGRSVQRTAVIFR